MCPPTDPGADAARTLSTELCPFCGEPREDADDAVAPNGTPRCRACLAFLDPLSRQVTQNHMGPWFIRDATRPFYPGVAYDVLVGLIARGDIGRDTAIRGPGTGQFWMRAAVAPGVAHLLGSCHACGAEASRGAERCRTCGVYFPRYPDRERLGLVVDERLSAFAPNEELRAGAPAPRPMAPRIELRPAPAAPRAADGVTALTPLERTLGEEIAGERRRTWWLAAVVFALLVVNVGLGVLVLLARRG
ncbi:MAG: hypothetical protein JNM94_10025 [Phycisphaerae bacterium]|nr:hypothetical protein [Phycisphaerae bacterium]